MLVHIRLGDDEQNVLALLDRHPAHVRHELQTQLQNSLTALLLAAGLLAA